MLSENQLYVQLPYLHHQVINCLKNLESNSLKTQIKSVLYHVTFYSEDGDHKLVDFKNETVSFTCQLIKI